MYFATLCFSMESCFSLKLGVSSSGTLLYVGENGHMVLLVQVSILHGNKQKISLKFNLLCFKLLCLGDDNRRLRIANFSHGFSQIDAQIGAPRRPDVFGMVDCLFEVGMRYRKSGDKRLTRLLDYSLYARLLAKVLSDLVSLKLWTNMQQR